MDGSRRTLATFSPRLQLTGSELPVSKVVKASQVHTDWAPLRKAGTFLFAPLSPSKTVQQTKEVCSADNGSAGVPAQLGDSWAGKPVDTRAVFTGKSDAVQRAKERMSRTLTVKTISAVTSPRRCLDFSPYSLADYRRIKPTFAQRLGGLGPVHVGSEDWLSAVHREERKRNFSEALRCVHTFAN